MSQITSSAEPFRYRDLKGPPRETIYDLAAMADALEGHLSSGTVPEADRRDVERFVRRAGRLLAHRDQGEQAAPSPNDLNDEYE